MAFPLCFSFPSLSPNYHHPPPLKAAVATTHLMAFQNGPRTRVIGKGWSFLGGSKVEPKFRKLTYLYQKSSSGSVLYASSFAGWTITTSASACTVFSLGTTAVLPFYVLMLLAPRSQLTRQCMGSMIPDTALGLLYGYLVYMSWTPDTLHLMFGAKYMVPELGGIAKMFSSEMRLTSAWIHLVAVDLFAARKVYNDGLENGVETRHSVALCLLACPLGILTHLITKTLTAMARPQTPDKPPN